MKNNPIKKVKAFVVIQGRNTVAQNNLFKWGIPEKIKKWDARLWMDVMCIFASKRKAMQYVAHWRNSDEFSVVPIEFEIPEVN